MIELAETTNLSYKAIGTRFGITKQRVAYIMAARRASQGRDSIGVVAKKAVLAALEEQSSTAGWLPTESLTLTDSGP